MRRIWWLEDRLLVEVKCVEHLSNEHLAQCINYLKASGLKLALLINFRRSKVEWRRVVHNLRFACIRVHSQPQKSRPSFHTAREASAARRRSCKNPEAVLGFYFAPTA